MGEALADREWMRPRQAAEYLGISLSTLYLWRRKGLVRFYRLGPRAVALRREELDGIATPTRAEQSDADPFQELFAFNDELYAKYGLMPDSTPQIRRDRENR